MSRRTPSPLLLLPLLAAVAACSQDPMERPGTWQPAGLNDGNLRAMVVDPAHLQRGLESHTTRGAVAADAVDLLRRGKRRDIGPKQEAAGIQLNLRGGRDAGD